MAHNKNSVSNSFPWQPGRKNSRCVKDASPCSITSFVVCMATRQCFAITGGSPQTTRSLVDHWSLLMGLRGIFAERVERSNQELIRTKPPSADATMLLVRAPATHSLKYTQYWVARCFRHSLKFRYDLPRCGLPFSRSIPLVNLLPCRLPGLKAISEYP